jgi:hypothetical protein
MEASCRKFRVANDTSLYDKLQVSTDKFPCHVVSGGHVKWESG